MESLRKLLGTARSFTPRSKEYVLYAYEAHCKEFEESWKKLISNPKNQEFCTLLSKGLWLQWEDWPKHYEPKEAVTLYARLYRKCASNQMVACLKVVTKKH